MCPNLNQPCPNTFSRYCLLSRGYPALALIPVFAHMVPANTALALTIVEWLLGIWPAKSICTTRSLGALRAPASSWRPFLGRLWALRTCLTSSFAPFGHSGRVTHATIFFFKYFFLDFDFRIVFIFFRSFRHQRIYSTTLGSRDIAR